MIVCFLVSILGIFLSSLCVLKIMYQAQGRIVTVYVTETPMQVEKVEEEHALLDVPRVGK
jgi:ABC-type molybdate transport system permease subunit